MAFPNTAYKPGDVVWYIGWLDQPCKTTVKEVVWTEYAILYNLEGRGFPYDMDDLFPTEAAAQKEAEKRNG